MKILLIGNFAPPYEEESLHNLSLFNRLIAEGHECSAINISDNPSIEKGFIDNRNYVGFILKVLRYGFGKDAIHFLTKGYTRPGLMKMFTAIFLGRFMFSRTFITLHPELFSVFGQLRSKMGGQMLIHLSFSLSNRVICGDKHTYEVASIHYKSREKFAMIPSFIQIPSGMNSNEVIQIEKLKARKKVILFSNLRFPSLSFDILDILLRKYLNAGTGIAVSFSEKFSSKLEHGIKDTGQRMSDNILFIDYSDHRMLSLAYASADMIIRPLSCDGKTLFDGIAVCVRKPETSAGQVFFPVSLSLVKEGDVSDTCSYLFNSFLMKDEAASSKPGADDLGRKIIGLYSGKS
ncbi:MAG: glycosyltransferase [Nitrospirae bacterium]|nr:glycosyltransferase [Nitrospirota bacterium]